MGSQLCPGSAKQIIQELQEIEKGQKSYEVLFKGCLNVRQNRVNELLFQQGQYYHVSHQPNIQQSQHLSSAKSQQNIQDIIPIEFKENPIIQIEFQDGSKYKGEVKDGVPHGQGEEYTVDGYYKGTFNMGMKEGFGIYNFKNKQTYEGQFKQNMLWGKGKYTFANGDSFIGQFIKNQRSGKGRYIFQKNNKEKNEFFQGEYKNDLKQGKGKLKNTNYEMFGIWKCGLYEFSLDQESIK